MSPREESRWEGFARENAEHYIWTKHRDYTEPQAMASFVESGRREAQEIVNETRPFLAHPRAALEIGCGVGRLAIPMAAHFERIFALDISPTMLRRLSEYCERDGVGNVTPVLSTASWADGVQADLVYSRLVFQHLESPEIEAYLAGTAACLEEGGVAYLQFDTRPGGIAYRIKTALPDRLLPRPWRRGIRRIRRSPEQVRFMIDRNGLAILHELRPASEDHVFLVRRLAG